MKRNILKSLPLIIILIFLASICFLIFIPLGYPHLEFPDGKERRAMISKKWKSMDDKEKKPYVKMAKKAAAKWKEDHSSQEDNVTEEE